MKQTVPCYQFTGLSENELMDIQGGGLLTNLVTSASATAIGLIAFGAVGLGLSKGIISNAIDFVI
jgi:lactobin A/cerein 7B family class IIb bacteriocin